VVAVLIGVLSIAQGFRRAMTVSGSPDTALVLRSGSDNEMVSGIGREDTRIIADAPGVARNADGPLASAELFVIINLPKRSTGTDANVPLRGVERPAFKVKDVRIVEGRMFDWGKNEVLVGTGAAKEFAGLNVGNEIKLGRIQWKVTGLLEAGGGMAESEIWTDATVLQGAYHRGNTFQSVYAKLDSPAAFDKFKDSLTRDPRVSVKPIRQPEYYEEQSKLLHDLITVLGTIVAVLMAVGAVAAYSMVMTFILLKLVALMVPLRVPASAEEQGLDISQHGEKITG